MVRRVVNIYTQHIKKFSLSLDLEKLASLHAIDIKIISIWMTCTILWHILEKISLLFCCCQQWGSLFYDGNTKFLYTPVKLNFLSSCSKSIVTDLCFTIYLKLDFIDTHGAIFFSSNWKNWVSDGKSQLSRLIYDFPQPTTEKKREGRFKYIERQ